MFGGEEYRRLLRGATAAVFLAALLAVVPAGAAAPAHALSTGWVESTITAADTGLPIEGVCLSAAYSIDDEALASLGCSDSEGHVETPPLVPGYYDLFVDPPEDSPFYPQALSGARGRDTSQLLAVTAGAATTRDFQLVRGGTISGTVVSDSDGSPIPGTYVYAGGADDALTDAAGHFVLGPLGSGSYTVDIEAHDGVHLPEKYDGVPFGGSIVGTNVVVVDGADTAISVGLAVGLAASGTVVDDLGQPVPGACVRLQTYYGPPVCADSLGRYTIGGLPPGPVVVWAEAVGYDWASTTFDAASTTTAPPLVLRRSASISGTIRDAVSGAPVNGGTVVLATSPWGGQVSAPVGPDGTYVLTNFLSLYTYRVRYAPSAGSTFAPRYYGNSYTFNEAMAVAFAEPGESLSGIDIDVEVGGTLNGRVVDSTGSPIVGANVRAVDSGLQGYLLGPVLTGADGTFSLVGVAAGQYYVGVEGPADAIPAFAAVDYFGNGSSQVSVVVGATTELGDVALERLARISGSVTDAALGIAVPGWVEAYDLATGHYAGSATAINGLYSIDVPPGTYVLKLTPYGGFAPLYSVQQTLHSAATPVVVAAGDVEHDIDFVVEPAPPGFVGLPSPQRLIDTRPGLLGLLEQSSADVGTPLLPNVAQRFVVGGAGELPIGAGVALTVTAVGPVAGGFLVVYPCATVASSAPPTSTLNLRAGVTIANTAVVQPGPDGGVCVKSSVTTHLILDATGHFGPAFVGRSSPLRLVDTRPGKVGAAEQADGSIGVDVVLPVSPSNASLRFLRISPPGSPPTVTGFAINITVVNPSASGWLTIDRCPSIPESEHVGPPRSTEASPASSVSTINFAKGVTVANSSVVGSYMCIAASVSTHVIIDVVGAFEYGAGSYGVRLVDTRPLGLGRMEIAGGTIGQDVTDQLIPGVPQRFVIDGHALRTFSTPSGRYALNLTAVGATAKGYLAAYPCNAAADPVPATSSLNFIAGINQAGTVYVDVGAGGGLCVVASRAVHLIIDHTNTFA